MFYVFNYYIYRLHLQESPPMFIHSNFRILTWTTQLQLVAPCSLSSHLHQWSCMVACKAPHCNMFIHTLLASFCVLQSVIFS